MRKSLLSFALGCFLTFSPTCALARELGTFRVTAYHGAFEGKKIPITKSGTIAQSGRTVAVDPKVIPLGSAIVIEGVGCRIAEDTGSAIKGPRLDVYLPSIPAAKRFGVKRLRTYILPPLPAHQRACHAFRPRSMAERFFDQRSRLHDALQLTYQRPATPRRTARKFASDPHFFFAQLTCDLFEHGLTPYPKF